VTVHQIVVNQRSDAKKRPPFGGQNGKRPLAYVWIKVPHPFAMQPFSCKSTLTCGSDHQSLVQAANSTDNPLTFIEKAPTWRAPSTPMGVWSLGACRPFPCLSCVAFNVPIPPEYQDIDPISCAIRAESPIRLGDPACELNSGYRFRFVELKSRECLRAHCACKNARHGCCAARHFGVSWGLVTNLEQTDKTD
jgi:hypothetical protein